MSISLTNNQSVQEYLKNEANSIFAHISYISELYDQKSIAEYDYVGLYILIYLSIRRPNNWINGKLKPTLSETWFNESKLPYNPNIIQAISVKLQNYPDILKLLGGGKYISKKLGISMDSDEYNKLTVVSAFDQLQLKGIKKNKDNHVNRNIVYWALSSSYHTHSHSHIRNASVESSVYTSIISSLSSSSSPLISSSSSSLLGDNLPFHIHRPFKLMFTIPSPMDVLRQQATGARVLTLFRTHNELSTTHKAMLYYMDGMQNHQKDSLEFLIHDMTHMEHYINDDIFLEQVGFFKCFLSINNYQPKLFFNQREFDEELWRELEYVISDM